MSARMKGLDKVMANLNKELARRAAGTVAGLMVGGLIIQAEAQRRVPIHFGNLRGSAYTRKSPKDSKSVEVGFSAAYAAAIHENLEASWRGQPRRDGVGVYWGPSGEPKYLENAVKEKRREVLMAAAKGGRRK